MMSMTVTWEWIRIREDTGSGFIFQWSLGWNIRLSWTFIGSRNSFRCFKGAWNPMWGRSRARKTGSPEAVRLSICGKRRPMRMESRREMLSFISVLSTSLNTIRMKCFLLLAFLILIRFCMKDCSVSRAKPSGFTPHWNFTTKLWVNRLAGSISEW